MGGLPAPVCDKELEDMIYRFNSCDKDKLELSHDEVEVVHQSVAATRDVSEKMTRMVR